MYPNESLTSTALATESVSQVLARLWGDPWRELILRWNWKSAVFGALIRGGIFFLTNLSAGRNAAIGAMLAEIAWRLVVTGFYGAFIQSLRRAHPAWQATIMTSLALPIFNHSIEFAIHYLRGTPKLKASIIASVCFTCISMLFNTYAMRRGYFVVGPEGRPIGRDLAAIPKIVAGFVLWLIGLRSLEARLTGHRA